MPHGTTLIQPPSRAILHAAPTGSPLRLNAASSSRAHHAGGSGVSHPASLSPACTERRLSSDQQRRLCSFMAFM